MMKYVSTDETAAVIGIPLRVRAEVLQFNMKPGSHTQSPRWPQKALLGQLAFAKQSVTIQSIWASCIAKRMIKHANEGLAQGDSIWWIGMSLSIRNRVQSNKLLIDNINLWDKHFYSLPYLILSSFVLIFSTFQILNKVHLFKNTNFWSFVLIISYHLICICFNFT